MSLMDSKVKKDQPESAYIGRVAMSPPRLIAPENGVERRKDACAIREEFVIYCVCVHAMRVCKRE
jgi:hypothetical protein